MVGVDPHLLEIVVFARDSDALLSVGAAGVVPPPRPQKDVLELVHPRVRKKQGRVVGRHDGCARHELVALLLEEREELVSDLLAGLHIFVSPLIVTISGDLLMGRGCARAGRPNQAPKPEGSCANGPGGVKRCQVVERDGWEWQAGDQEIK